MCSGKRTIKQVYPVYKRLHPVDKEMVMAKLKLLILSCAITACAAETYANDAIYPLVTYKCSPEADIITLTNSLIPSEEGATYQYSDKNGTYSPWDLVEINNRTEGTRIVRTKKITKKCKLSSGEYTVTLEPQVFNRDFDGDCGATISSAFTVSHDAIEIQQRTPFEDYCSGDSPVITRVTVFGRTGEVKIKRIPRSNFY
jgi:hypothetical protein